MPTAQGKDTSERKVERDQNSRQKEDGNTFYTQTAKNESIRKSRRIDETGRERRPERERK